MSSSLIFGFSRATDGTMAIDGGWENRLRYLQRQGLDPRRTVHAGLCHGATTAFVTAVDGGTVVPETDGLITVEPDVALVMTAADCLLLTVIDATSPAIGLMHAGRRGLAAGVIPSFFATWNSRLSSTPSNLRISISPSICQNHYPVSPADAAAFSVWPSSCRTEGDQVFLDLRQVALAHLQEIGIPSEQITVSPECTFERAEYFSYRRDHPAKPQLQLGYIMRPAA